MNTQTSFGSKSRFGAVTPATPLDILVTGVRKQLDMHSTFASRDLAKSAMALESMDPALTQELQTSVTNLNAALEEISNTVLASFGNGRTKDAAGNEVPVKFSKSQMMAANVAGIVGSDIPSFLAQPVKRDMVSTESAVFIGAPGASGDFFDARAQKALEAYDEKENKNTVVYSVAYNLQAARQDEFGETFFPTVVVTPDQVGFTVAIRIVSVMNEVRRQINGNLDNFGKRNIIQAVIDPTILRNDQTKIVPVYRTESAAHFVPSSVLAPRDVYLEGETITTSALAMGKKFSLLAISQTEALLETGLQDSTDSIDTALALATLYMKVGTEVFSFQTARLPTATFTYAPQGNYRLMNLAFKNSSLKLDNTLKTVAGADSTELEDIKTGNYTVRLGVSVSGSVNLETAETDIFSSGIAVAKVTNAAGESLSLETGPGKAIADLFAAATMVGYELDAQRTNLNRRQRGQLLDTTYYNQVYAVPLRSPITIPRPLTVGDVNDSSDLAALITATHIRTSNAAVDELLRVKDVLKDYVSATDLVGDTPEILGIARSLVKPFYEEFTLAVPAAIDSIKSHERAADIQATLVNQLRDMAYRMYRDSGYKAAADALAGGMAQVPTIIIGTDPVLSRYLTVNGDLRTLGNDFNVKIVSTLNMRMAGKIVMSFGEFGGGSEGVPNPMHFGNMAWKPELTLVLPLHRNGANSKELTVQPSFLHIVNLPIMASVEVTGISDVVSKKVAVNMHTVP